MRPTEQRFPTQHVEASARDAALQREASANAHLFEAEWKRAEQVAAAAGHDVRELKWIYFRSPPETWAALCGRAGWMLWNPTTKSQVAFLLEIMN